MIGNIFLTLALIAGAFTVLMYYLNYRGYQNTLGIARISFHFTAVMIMAASALLLHAILTHQYQYNMFMITAAAVCLRVYLSQHFMQGRKAVFCSGHYFLQLLD